jgi:hypothetical protein
MPWSTPFDEPIRLRGGARLTTLQHAADYVMTLPEDVQRQQRWQTAVENLINAAEIGGGWLMFARIGMLRALNADGKGRQARSQSPQPQSSPSPKAAVISATNSPR